VKPQFQVLFEDNHLLVLNKPAGLATMGVAAGDSSLLTQAKQYIKQKYRKPGNVYVGVVSRLDAPASGVIVFARTSKAAARLTEQFRAGTVEKTYWALVSPPPTAAHGAWADWLQKDERQQRMLVVREATKKGAAKLARLTYDSRWRATNYALLVISLDTGRKHQIRVQCAHHGCPVVGDRKYGSRTSFSSGIALHARRLVLSHPTRDERLTFDAPLPTAWQELAAQIGWDLQDEA
jgi:23S rRNA pseudouridine1911/1915/1917 synthase